MPRSQARRVVIEWQTASASVSRDTSYDPHRASAVVAQTKLALSSRFPVPLYRAYEGYAQSGRVRPGKYIVPGRADASMRDGAALFSTHSTIAASPSKLSVAGPPAQWFMGGAQTFGTAIENLDKFAYIGGFSGSSGGRGGFDPKTSSGGVFADAAAFNKKVKLLFLSIGSEEGPGTKNFSQQLTQAGITNVYYESPGTAHEWLTWRRSLKEFATRLFR